jgi:hypothetical protein
MLSLHVSLNSQSNRKDTRALAEELKEVKAEVNAFLESTGKSSLEVDGVQIVIESKPRKAKKKAAVYEDDVKNYLESLGLQDVDEAFDELQLLKSGKTSLVSDLKVI